MRRLYSVVLVFTLFFAATWACAQGQYVRGIVFEDLNKNGVRDAGEAGIKGVRVSNGAISVKTDRHGAYRLPIDDDTIVFVVKPKNWMVPVDANNVPRFYYIHKPAGSPKMIYPGVEPTGPLPSSVDFALYRQREPNKFSAIFMGDPQVRNKKEIAYMSRDVVAELVGTDAAFCITLGDIAFDELSVYESIIPAMGKVGVPMFYVKGNHDINYDAFKNQTLTNETWERVLGPSYYSFDYGPVHFIVLDNPNFSGGSGYTAKLDPKQMEFLKDDLANTPRKQLLVLSMHIPITQMSDRKEIYELLKDRPNVLSFSAHTHTQDYRILSKDNGWDSPHLHLHVVNGATCGSWWSGALDEVGIPHTTMSDGTPNGYSIVSFNASKYSIRFKAARRPDDYQMNIYAPDIVKLSDVHSTQVLVNVFAGSERSKVEMSVDSSDKWVEMVRELVKDPGYANTNAGKCPHIWGANLPAGLTPGTHLINIRVTDMFKQIHRASRVISIEQ